MPPQTEQLTIRIDSNGKILNFDTTQLRPQFAAFITKEIGHQITELCHYQDKHRLQVHFKEVIQNPSDAQMTTYRLKLGAPDLYVPVKVHSRMFSSAVQNEPDFIMAIHTILSEHDSSSHESPALHAVNMLSIIQPQTSQSMSLNHQHLKQQMHHSSMGGPLMTSIINGGLSQISPRNGQNNSATNSLLNDNGNSSTSLLQQSSAGAEPFFAEPFDFIDFPSSTFDMENSMFMEARPDSRASITPVSTPRPASATAAYSPAGPPMCPSPLTPYHGGAGSAGQPSPSNISNNNNNSNMANNNLTSNSNSGSGSNFSNNNFTFPFDDKEKVQEQIQQHQLQQQKQDANSGKLRNLLTKTPHASGSGMDGGEQERNPNQILKVSDFSFCSTNTY
jgi:nuclear receptor coactivator 2